MPFPKLYQVEFSNVRRELQPVARWTCSGKARLVPYLKTNRHRQLRPQATEEEHHMVVSPTQMNAVAVTQGPLTAGLGELGKGPSAIRSTHRMPAANRPPHRGGGRLPLSLEQGSCAREV